MSGLYTQTVDVLRAELVADRYGNTAPDWSRTTRTTYRGVSVQPDSSTEGDGERQQVVTGWRLITQRGRDIDIRPGDRVEHAGRLLDTDGDVGRWEIAGRVHHVEVRLKEVTG